ncbi:MAG: DUF1599 domain-containing protein [Cytophagales bacterium]|nr:DUF1599 domain-containing protein [Cytophagales bacterium]
MNKDTLSQYNEVIKACKGVFEKKTKDYGTAWRILRLPSITDQIMIKAQRIRAIQEKGVQRVSDDVSTEFIGIVNYCIMALMQIMSKDDKQLECTFDTLEPLYDKAIADILLLLAHKNHDYQEAWRAMRISSITDIILMKLLRIKKIEDNQGKTLFSEGVQANYQDIVNYAVFSLIKLGYVEE